jgi:hypothetical protein
MSSRSERIKQLVEEVLAGRHWYFDLDTCPPEERPAIREKILDVDGKIVDLCQLLKTEPDENPVQEG